MEKLGNILVRSGQLSSDRLEEALIKSLAIGRRLGWVLVQEGLVTEEDLAHALARQLNMDVVDLDSTPISLDAVRLLPRRVAVNYTILPIRVEGRLLTIAASDPTNVTVDDIVRATTGYDVKTVVATPSAIARHLERYYPSLPEEVPSPQERAVPGPPATAPTEAPPQPHELETVALVAQTIQSMLTEAVRRHSRRIHGRLPWYLGRSFTVGDGSTTVSVSAVPDLYGERIEVTISDRYQYLTRLEGLGLTPPNVRAVESLLAGHQGLILVVGPPVSGKTTTLYAALHHLRRSTRRIVTVEDPIAQPLDGVLQLPADVRGGVSLAEMVSVARHLTPEVIMVGDLSDRSAARAAFEAAVDGYLVLAAMEANDAPSAIAHLIQTMLLPPDLVAAGLIGVIAQRLVRRIHPLCKESHWPAGELLVKYFGTARTTHVQPLYHGKGCRLCDRGYHGYTGLFQILPVTNEIRALIHQRASVVELMDAVTALGLSHLSDDGLDKVLNGITTLEELDRVIAHRPALEGSQVASRRSQVTSRESRVPPETRDP